MLCAIRYSIVTEMRFCHHPQKDKNCIVLIPYRGFFGVLQGVGANQGFS